MNSERDDIFSDKLGIIHALAAHLASGENIDEVADERVFDGIINPIAAKIEMVTDENFGGDSNAFHTKLLEVIATAVFAGKDPVIEIDLWLNAEWEKSGRLYH